MMLNVDTASNVAEKATGVIPARGVFFINAHDAKTVMRIVAGVEIDVYWSYDV